MIARVWEMLRTKFVRDAATLQVATGVSQIFQVATTVVLAVMLDADGQGAYYIAIALYGLVYFLINVGVLQATVSQVAAAAARKNEYKSSGWLAFLAKTVAAFGVLIFVAGWFVLPWVSELIYEDRDVGVWAWWLCALPLIELPKVVATAAFQGTRRMVALGQLDNSCELVKLFLVICGAIVTESPQGAIFGLLLSSVVGAVLAAGLYHRARTDGGYPLPSAHVIVQRARGIKISQGIRQGLRVALLKNGQSLFVNIFPRLIIGAVSGLEYTAYFHIAQRLMSVPMMLADAIRRTALPALGELAGKKDLVNFRRLFFRTAIITGVLTTAALLVLLGLIPWLTRSLYPPGYMVEVYKYSGILLFGYIPFAFATANEAFYIVANKLKALLWITLVGAVITIPLNVLLIDRIDFYGTAWGLVLYQSWVLVHLFYISAILLRAPNAESFWRESDALPCPACGESATPGGVPFWVIILSVTSLCLSFLFFLFPGKLAQVLGLLGFLIPSHGAELGRLVAAFGCGFIGLFSLIAWREQNSCGACGNRWPVRRRWNRTAPAGD